MLSSNVIIMWAGTNATIPAGFTRETVLDGKYPKSVATGVNPGSRQGGAATHTHTSPSHTHTIAAHTHTYTLAAGNDVGAEGAPGSYTSIAHNHTHSGTSGAISGGITGATAVTYGSVSNDPTYYTVIFIKAQGMVNIPSNAIIWTKNSSAPTGFTQHAASRNYFFKGAATGGNGGSTGGSNTNTHDISHSHTAGSHTHVAANSNASGGIRAGSSGTDNAHYTHVHSVALYSQSVSIPNYSSSLTTSETVMPAYTALQAIQNTSGAAKGCVSGMVAIWLGTLETIPNGWYFCDGNNGTPNLVGSYKYIYNVNTAANVLTTGGANSHTHAAQSHTHSASSSHTHAFDEENHSTGGGGDANPAHVAKLGVLHPEGTSTPTTASYASATTTAASSSNEPLYKEVAFIMFDHLTIGAALMHFL